MAGSNLLPREGAIKKTDGGALLFPLLPPSPLSTPSINSPSLPTTAHDWGGGAAVEGGQRAFSASAAAA